MKAKSQKKKEQPAALRGPQQQEHQKAVYVTPSTEEQAKYFEKLGDVMQQDLEKCENLMKEMASGEKETLTKIQELLEFTADPETRFDSGINFYSCKNLIFNEYLICLKYYQLFKLKGIGFTEGTGLELYQRMVYLKTLILKLSPVEKKLEYQKNKLLKKGEKAKIQTYKKHREQEEIEEEEEEEEEEDGSKEQQDQANEDEEEDNLMFKPRVNNLISAEKSKKNPESNKEKYVAVKQTAVLPADQKQKRRDERQKQRKKAFLLRKFRGDIDSGDEAQEKGVLHQMDQKFKKRYEEKTLMEEADFTRYGETKKEKYWRKKMMKNQFQGNQLNDELKEVSMIRQLVDEEASKRSRPFESSRQKPQKKMRKPN